MNQERFDDLTRALATGRLSRRQVLKSFAAGVLLAGPLGSLWQKAGVAQTLGCVSPKCVKRADREYAKCNRGCGRVTNSAECLEECESSYAGELGVCGCVTINTDTATGDVTYAPCEDPCTPQTLSEQAHQDRHYSTLADFLTSGGFAADGSPLPVVIKEDGQLVHTMLVSTYNNPTRTNEIGGLYYDVVASGDTLVFAAIWGKQEENLLYLLVVDEAGHVQKVNPPEAPQQSPEAPQQTSGPNTVSSAAAAQICDSTKLGECLRVANLGFQACLARAKEGFIAAMCVAAYGVRVNECTKPPVGCGLLSTSFCTNNVCCPLGETGCGGAVCCDGLCEKCEAGGCVSRCKNGEVCCVQTGFFGGVECCNPCADCLGGRCIAKPGDRAPCGEVCCEEGLSCCNNICVNTKADKLNCGACGNKCSQCQDCQESMCVSTGTPCGTDCCEEGETCCNGQCVDEGEGCCPPDTTPCGSGTTGACCPPTFTCCPGSRVSTCCPPALARCCNDPSGGAFCIISQATQCPS